MAVGIKTLPVMHPVSGVRLNAVAAGIRKAGRRDLVMIECAPGTAASAVFTRNRFCAAPVTIARQHMAVSSPRVLVINTGYANAGTGQPGIADAQACCAAVAGQLKIQTETVVPFSTGVIGERLPVDKIIAAIPECLKGLNEAEWEAAAHGIMTTDTVAKGSSRVVESGSARFTITGIAKGAGMIRPDMATMLAFIATDAAVDHSIFQGALERAVDASFNRISVDGDTSTNDACVLLATGKASGVKIERAQGKLYESFMQGLHDVCAELAQAIVRDGEGATKFITIEVSGGASEADCLEVAYSVAHSPLVKTAFFASDPNWGRILAAVGYARVSNVAIDKVAIHVNDVSVVRNGARDPEYSESQGQAAMRVAEIRLRIDLGVGTARARVWTTDLSHEYVKINAEYRS